MDTQTFGIVGGFKGDDKKRAFVQGVAGRVERGDDSVTAMEVVEVFNTVPFSGRVQFMVNVLSKSKLRDRLVSELFEWCFDGGLEAESDSCSEASFVLIGCESTQCLNTLKMYMMKVLVLIIPLCGKLGVDLFHQYERSTSTKFRIALRLQMVRSTDFTDAELEAAYIDSVDVARTAILQECYRAPHRKEFLANLVAKGLAHDGVLFHADPSIVRKRLLSPDPDEANKVARLGLLHWKVHSATYLEYLDTQLAKHGNPLERGYALRKFEKLAKTGFEAEHAIEVVRIVAKHKPLELCDGLGNDIKAYLQSLAADHKLTEEYADVRLCRPCPDIVAKVRGNIAFLQEHTGGAPLCYDPEYEWLCTQIASHRFNREGDQKEVTSLRIKAYADLPALEFWRHVRGKDQTTLAGRTFQTLHATLATNKSYRLTNPSLDALVELFRRYTPDSVPEEVVRDLGMLQLTVEERSAALWKSWLEAGMRCFKAQIAVAAGKTKTNIEIANKQGTRNSITSSCGYYRATCERALELVKLAAPHVPLDVYIQTLRGLFAPADTFITTPDCPPVALLQQTMDGAILEVLPRVVDSIDFSLQNEAFTSCAHRSQMIQFRDGLLSLGVLRRSLAVRKEACALWDVVATRATLTHEQATQGFEIRERKDGKKEFVHYNKQLLREYSDLASAGLRSIMEGCGKKDDGVLGKAWEQYKDLHFGATGLSGRALKDLASPPRNKTAETAYFAGCLLLSESLLKAERPVLLEVAARNMEASDYLSIAPKLKQMGVSTMDVIAKAKIPEDTKANWVERCEGVYVPAVRKNLEEKTTDRDMHARMAAHVALLQASIQCDVIREVAVSLQYVAHRIKNEAGLTRPQAYDWVGSNIATIVKKCLKEGDEENSKTITEALEKMLRDDVSKRDTVAKSRFEGISKTIINTVLTIDATSAPALPLRTLWITSAIRMGWIVIKNIRGEAEWKNYCWPLTATYPLMVPEDDLEKVYRPFLGASISKYCTLSSWAYQNQRVLKPGVEMVSAQQLVDCLVKGLKVVQNENNLAEGAGPDTEFSRVKALLRFTKGQWSSVKVITDYTAATTKALSSKVTEERWDRAFDLLQTAKGCYKGMWYQVPLLADLCHALFHAAMNPCITTQRVHRITDIYTDMSTHIDRVSFSALSAVQVQVLATHFGTTLTKRTLNSEEYKHESLLRVAKLSAKLLDLSPSAIHLSTVQNTLTAKRDDMLLEFIGEPADKFEGPFHRSSEPSKQPFLFYISRANLDNMTGAAAQRYSRITLDRGLSRDKSTHVRAQAITEYVSAPTTCHTDVIDLLKMFGRKQEGNDDDSVHTIIEAVVLSAFQTDAAWFVLAYLLTPENIRETPQRTTASILSSFSKQVHTDRLVNVLKALLAPGSREAIAFYLHKSILNMLVEAGTESAADILYAEWTSRGKNKLHQDIIRLLVRVALTQAATGPGEKPMTKVGWKILHDVPKDSAIPADTALLLTTACPSDSLMGSAGSVSFTTAAVPPPGKPSHFAVLWNGVCSETVTWFANKALCQDFADLMAALTVYAGKDEDLKAIVMAKQVVHLINAGEAGIAKALGICHDVLQNPPRSVEDIGDRQRYQWKVFSTYYTLSVIKVLDAKVQASTVREIDYTAYAKEGNPTKLTNFVRTLYISLLDTPPRDKARRVHLSEVVKTVVGVLKGTPWFKHLVTSPLEKEVALIRDDAVTMQNIY